MRKVIPRYMDILNVIFLIAIVLDAIFTLGLKFLAGFFVGQFIGIYLIKLFSNDEVVWLDTKREKVIKKGDNENS